jgi:hypothetical protein
VVLRVDYRLRRFLRRLRASSPHTPKLFFILIDTGCAAFNGASDPQRGQRRHQQGAAAADPQREQRLDPWRDPQQQPQRHRKTEREDDKGGRQQGEGILFRQQTARTAMHITPGDR